MIVLTLQNDKGGVGKTTSAVNLAAELGSRGYRVLVCDLDPQANLTRSSVGLKVEELNPSDSTLALVLGREEKLTRAPRPRPLPEFGFDLVPAVHRLVDADVRLVGQERRLAEGLAPFASRYDVCFLDTEPQFGSLHMNALYATDGVLIPVIPNVSSTSGLDMMFTKIALVQRVNPRLRPLGVFAVKVQRTGLHRQMQLMLERQLKELWLDAPVPQTVAIENSEVFHQPVRAYDPLAKAANSYRLLADKLLDRLGREGLLDANERAAA